MSEPKVILIIEKDKVSLRVNNRKREWLLPEGIQEYTINSVINSAIRNQVSEEVREKIRTKLHDDNIGNWLWYNP